MDIDEKAAITALRLDAEAWDCHANHYVAYWWEDLVEAGMDGYMLALGWDKETWDGDGDEPASEDSYWDDLTAEERAAAGQICYFGELWDGETSVAEWGFQKVP